MFKTLTLVTLILGKCYCRKAPVLWAFGIVQIKPGCGLEKSSNCVLAPWSEGEECVYLGEEGDGEQSHHHHCHGEGTGREGQDAFKLCLGLQVKMMV